MHVSKYIKLKEKIKIGCFMLEYSINIRKTISEGINETKIYIK